MVRKDIARVLTVINQTQRDHVRKFYEGKKYKPTDLRNKKVCLAFLLVERGLNNRVSVQL